MRTTNILFGLVCSLTAYSQNFKPDTTINQINLESSRTLIKKLKTDTSKIHEAFKEDWGEIGFPHIDILNKTRDQILTLIFHPGNWTYAFSEFKVKSSDKKTTNKTILFNDSEFITEKEIKLGTLKTDLIKRIGKPTTMKKENGLEIIEYRTNDQNSRILKRYGQVGYFAIYKLKNDKVIEFHFGFDYP